MGGERSRGERDFWVERMGDREVMKGVSGERRDDVVVIEGDGGRDEGGQNGRRGRGEGVPHQLDSDWDGNSEGKEGGDGDRLLSRGL